MSHQTLVCYCRLDPVHLMTRVWGFQVGLLLIRLSSEDYYLLDSLSLLVSQIHNNIFFTSHPFPLPQFFVFWQFYLYFLHQLHWSVWTRWYLSWFSWTVPFSVLGIVGVRRMWVIGLCSFFCQTFLHLCFPRQMSADLTCCRNLVAL